MNEHEAHPVGELGAAFAALADDAPGLSYSAADVIAEAQRVRSRRRTILAGVAAALVGVTVVIGAVRVAGRSTSTATSATSAAGSVAAANGLSSAASASAGATKPEASPNQVEAGGGSALDPSIPASTEAAADEVSSAALGCEPLSAAQLGLVNEYLDGLGEVSLPAGCSAYPGGSVVGQFSGPSGASLSVLARTGIANPCSTCKAVPGHPDASFEQSGDTSGAIFVVATGPTGTVGLSAQPATNAAGPSVPAFTVEQLAELAEALLATL